MFGRGKSKEKEPLENQMNGFIGKGMSIEGRLNFEGSIRIDGDFKGEIDSDGLLIIGEGALVEAVISVGSAIICGEVRGDIDVSSKVELKKPAHIHGNIKTQSIVIEDGVVYEGHCIMKGESLSTESS
ncbi:MAG: polymer-forming cytoskeletal protein [Deltaproteobacteria bacterium]|nr:polymer-forming cytoskeletal protein [Deltaproteobacteria bacterium]